MDSLAFSLFPLTKIPIQAMVEISPNTASLSHWEGASFAVSVDEKNIPH
jgi:hypothetical protein